MDGKSQGMLGGLLRYGVKLRDGFRSVLNDFKATVATADSLRLGGSQHRQNIKDWSTIEPNQPLPLLHPEPAVAGQPGTHHPSHPSHRAQMPGFQAKAFRKFDRQQCDGDTRSQNRLHRQGVLLEIGIVEDIGARRPNFQHRARRSATDKDDLLDAPGQIRAKMCQGSQVGQRTQSQIRQGLRPTFQDLNQRIDCGGSRGAILRTRGTRMDLGRRKTPQFRQALDTFQGSLKIRVPICGRNTQNFQLWTTESQGQGKGIIRIMQKQSDRGIGVNPNGTGIAYLWREHR